MQNEPYLTLRSSKSSPGRSFLCSYQTNVTNSCATTSFNITMFSHFYLFMFFSYLPVDNSHNPLNPNSEQKSVSNSSKYPSNSLNLLSIQPKKILRIEASFQKYQKQCKYLGIEDCSSCEPFATKCHKVRIQSSSISNSFSNSMQLVRLKLTLLFKWLMI